MRAEVSTFRSGETKPENTLRVEFAHDQALGLLVSVEMREAFPWDEPAQGTGVATYRNFRRFQTSARIVPP